MSCIYTYDYKEFKNKEELQSYVSSKRKLAKNMYLDYQQEAFNMGQEPSVEGFKEYYTKFGGLPKLQSSSGKNFNVQSRNLAPIKTGDKTMSLRSEKDSAYYRDGDYLDVRIGKTDMGVKLKVKKIHTIKDFSKLNPKDKDRVAVKMGYRDFADMLESDPYLKKGSTLARKYPFSYNFITGQEEGKIIEYMVVKESPRELLTAPSYTPGLTKYKDMLEKSMIELYKQIEMLEKADIEPGDPREERLIQLNKLSEKLMATQDLLVISSTAVEDIKSTYESFKSLIEKENPDPQALLKKFFVFRRFYESYSFIEDLVKAGENLVKNSTEPGIDPHNAFAELEEANKYLTKIRATYLEHIEPLVAEALVPYVAEKGYEDMINEFEKVVARAEENLAKAQDDPDISPKALKKIVERVKNVKEYTQELAQNTAHDKNTILKALDFLYRDVDFWAYHLDSAQSSTDPITSLYTMFLKDQIYKEGDSTLRAGNRIEVAYEEFIEEVPESFSYEKMYGDLVEVYNGPESNYQDRLALVSQFRYKEFYQNLKEFREGLDLKQERLKAVKEIASITARQKKGTASIFDIKRREKLNGIINGSNVAKELKNLAVNDWVRGHTRDIDEKEAQLQINLFKASNQKDIVHWARNRMNKAAMHKHGILPTSQLTDKELKQKPMYFNEFRVPIDEYLNDKWLKLYTKQGTPKNAKGNFHKVLREEKLYAESKLPIFHRQGNVVPGKVTSFLGRLTEGQGLLSAISGSLKDLKKAYFGDPLREETSYGTQGTLNDKIDNIPVYFVNRLEPSETSMDIKSSILDFISGANTYHARNKALELGVFLYDKLLERKDNDRVDERTTKFKASYNSVAARLGIKRTNRKTHNERASNRFFEVLDMKLFGNNRDQEMIGNFRLRKAYSTFRAYISFVSFGLLSDAKAKIFQGASSNWLNQIGQQLVETGFSWNKDSEAFTMHDFVDGYRTARQYAKSLLISDWGKAGNKSYIGQVIDYFDAIQGETLSGIGTNVSGNKFRRAFTLSSLYIHRKFSEAHPQLALFFGYMNKIKVKQNGKLIPLIDAFELVKDGKVVEEGEGGSLQLKKGVEFSQEDRRRLRDHLHGLSHKINGIYDEFSKPVAEKSMVGETLMFFRQYLFKGLVRWWGRQKLDYGMDAYERGFATNYLNKLRHDIFTYRKGLNSFKSNDLTPGELADRSKLLTSAILYASLAGIISMLEVMNDDDEENSPAYYYLMYNLVRLQAETASFWNVTEMLRIIKSPTIMNTYLERALRFVGQLADPFEEYKRTSGANEKGDSKLKASFIKLLLGQTQYSEHPEIALRNFENLSN